MNNTTYTANQNCFLIDGEVCLTETQNGCSKGDMLYDEKLNEIYTATDVSTCLVKYVHKITRSTKKLDGVTMLPRDKFVKPVNLEELQHKAWLESELITVNGAVGFERGFKAGHNANPKEFTREEMIQAMNAAYNYPFTCIELLQEDKFEEERDRIINSLRALSLPASLEINEQGEIENVIW